MVVEHDRLLRADVLLRVDNGRAGFGEPEDLISRLLEALLQHVRAVLNSAVISRRDGWVADHFREQFPCFFFPVSRLLEDLGESHGPRFRGMRGVLIKLRSSFSYLLLSMDTAAGVLFFRSHS